MSSAFIKSKGIIAGSTRSYTMRRTKMLHVSTCKRSRLAIISGTLVIRHRRRLACAVTLNTNLRLKWHHSLGSIRPKWHIKQWRALWAMVQLSTWETLTPWEIKDRLAMPSTMARSSSMSRRQCNARHISNSSDEMALRTIPSIHLAGQSLSAKRQTEIICLIQSLGIMMVKLCPKKLWFSAKIWIKECKTTRRILARVFSRQANWPTTATLTQCTSRTRSRRGNFS